MIVIDSQKKRLEKGLSIHHLADFTIDHKSLFPYSVSHSLIPQEFFPLQPDQFKTKTKKPVFSICVRSFSTFFFH